MRCFYFLFNATHVTKSGVNLQNYWVRVIAKDYISAAIVFNAEFSVPQIGDSNQYFVEMWPQNFSDKVRSTCTDGEYALFKQDERIVYDFDDITVQHIVDYAKDSLLPKESYYNVPREKTTCFMCSDNSTCPFAWDAYNTDNDCLAIK